MKAVVVVEAADLRAGDEIVCIEESTLHTRVVHNVRNGAVTFAHGERISAKDAKAATFLTAREYATTEVDLPDNDDRDRSDLAAAADARARADASGHREGTAEWWDHYYGVDGAQESPEETARRRVRDELAVPGRGRR